MNKIVDVTKFELTLQSDHELRNSVNIIDEIHQLVEMIQKQGGNTQLVYVLGRNRKITVEGRKKLVTYKGRQITLGEARKLEKKLAAEKKAKNQGKGKK